MKSIAVIKLKVPCKKVFLETMKQYSKSAQHVTDKGWEIGEWYKGKLHPLTYRQIRGITKLPSQLVCSSRDKACEILKSLRKIKNPAKPIIKKHLTIRYDARSFWFKPIKNEYWVSLLTINGRIKFPADIPEYYWKYLDWNVRDANLILDRKDRLFLHITFARDISAPSDSEGVLGVDVGINHVAVTSNRKFFNAKQIKLKKIKFRKVRSKLQAKGTRSARRLLKKISGREKRFMAYWNHVISKQIVNNCNAGTIAIEELKGIRNSRKGKRFNFWLNSWSFYQLHSFISYKAARKGIKVMKASPYMTSQSCSKCGAIGSRSKGFFSCHCGYSLNADLNASFNLAKHDSNADRVLASVTKPIVSSDDAEAPFGELRQSSGANSQKPHTLV